MDPGIRRVIVAWLLKHIDGCDDPRVHGKGLTGDRPGEWRYRIGDYRSWRIIASRQADERMCD